MTELPDGQVAELTSIGFARLARRLIHTARDCCEITDLTMRSPGTRGEARQFKRTGSHVTVAVRYRNRPAIAVAADMIEGIAASHPDVVMASGRDALWITAVEVLTV